MPRGDKTGPWGAGSMTGRAAGYCAGYPVPGYVNQPYGYGRGMRRGRGRGFGRGWGRGLGRRQFVYPPLTPVKPLSQSNTPVFQQPTSEQELVALENYQKDLEAEKTDLDQEMDGVKVRIKDLQAKIEK